MDPKKFQLSKFKDELLFIPLGGVEQIGVNLYIYHYKGRLLIVDMGIGFADDYFPGVELLVPDISFLIEHKDKIDGLVLTHAHEDHIGAVQYLWQELEMPVYTSKFTSAVLKAKLAGEGIANEVDIFEVPTDSKFKVGSFDLESITLTHSVPEMQGLVIKTDKGNIFHTGDWKFDQNPLVGKTSNFKALKKLGDSGVLAMTCDSTNIFSEGRSGSEGELMKSLTSLIGECGKHLVVMTTFASNISRMYAIAKAAEANGRRVVLAGSSLWRMYTAAEECGYMDGVPQFIQPKNMKKHKREDLLVIATGCQGERFAATRKLAKDEYPHFKLQKGDTMIFASKIIPGNEKSIFSLFNHFSKLGIEVLTENDHFVHVSGHPNRDEVSEMYEMVRPKYAIPVHGETMHLHEHSKFAVDHGCKKAIQVETGTVVKISDEETKIVGAVPSGVMAIDGNFIIQSDSPVLSMRRKMRDGGLVIVSYVVDKRGKLLSLPVVDTPGVFDAMLDKENIEDLRDQIADYISDNATVPQSEMENKIRSIVKRYLLAEADKESKVVVQRHKIKV